MAHCGRSSDKKKEKNLLALFFVEKRRKLNIQSTI